MQVWPLAAKMPEIAPETASSSLASSNTMCADLPPSSSVTCLKSAAAATLTARPPASPPVKATLRTSGCVTSASPASWPKPVTTLITPGGIPASCTSAANSSVEADACSDGLMTTALPAASAGATFQAISSSGEFQGVMQATTPIGSGRVKFSTSGLSIGGTVPSILSASPP